MRAIRSRNTKPELAVRALLHAQGFRYRVDLAPTKGLRRRADIVFTRQRIAVFIDGCFWHYCPIHGRDVASNTEYWGPKLRRNVERDRETDAVLKQNGWLVLRFWEHEQPTAVTAAISTAVSDRRHWTG